ncbi:hypothetical protein ACFXGT_24825 [Streptomyces sp. NPDC059352]|uniref:hypothetical protein n=1 Tax=Streptomyces sp. NPDC059352 TaxID=3346810 RepID=UPI0036C50AD8
MAEKMQRLGGEARDGMKAKADKARWDGGNANVTRDFVGKTTGVVTAVPGPDGKPQVSIDYQVNVWDRYNWDPGKATPIGPTTVTDADMARMHTTGQAREFDMRGSSSVQQHDLTSGGAWPDPKEPGREDGTRTDIGRNGDAR